MNQNKDDLIYNQNSIPKNKWRYGFRSSAATGCGWIATYNALRLMGHKAEPEKLIHYFTWQVPLINGNMGTFLLGPAIYFKQKGFRTKITARRKNFDEVVQNSDVCILFYFWRRKWRIGSHFVTVRFENGKVIGYNTYRNSKGADMLGSSLEAFVKRQKYFGAVLIGVEDRNAAV